MLVADQRGSVACTQPAGATALSGLWQPVAVSSRSPTFALIRKYVVFFGCRRPVALQLPFASVFAVDT